MAPPLTPLSYVVLALVGEGGAGAHDIAAMMGRSGVYWAAAPSQWYAEPKRLAGLGLLAAEEQPGRTRRRTHYTLTGAGRRALRAWLAGPARFPRIQNEAAVRLLAGDMVEPEVIAASLRGMLPEIAALEATLADMIARASSVPHRERYLLLSHSCVRRLLRMHREWIAEVEQALTGPTSNPGSGSRAARRGRRRARPGRGRRPCAPRRRARARP